MVRALFHIDLNLSKEYKEWVNDMAKGIVIFLIIHILQILQNTSVSFLNEGFLQLLIFVFIALSFYHLVWKKLVQFVYDDNDEEGFKGTIEFFK